MLLFVRCQWHGNKVYSYMFVPHIDGAALKSAKCGTTSGYNCFVRHRFQTFLQSERLFQTSPDRSVRPDIDHAVFQLCDAEGLAVSDSHRTGVV